MDDTWSGDIRSDTISIKDFSDWAKEKDVSKVVAIREGYLISGWGIHFHVRETFGFCCGTNIDFATDFEQLKSDARELERAHDLPLGHTQCIESLHFYKKARYPRILEARKNLTSFYAFLAATNHPESASAILGELEVQGVMKQIYDFAVREVDAPVLLSRKRKQE